MTTIAINNLTQLDFAAVFDGQESSPNSPYIVDRPRVVGGSYNVSVQLTGPTKDGEEVVIDFGSAKKIIKELIDHKTMGLDHKLLLNGQQKCKDGNVGYGNTHYPFTAPDDAVHIVPFKLDPDTIESELAYYLSTWLTRMLNEQYAIVLEVLVTLNTTPILPQFLSDVPNHEPMRSACATFRYTHGLPRSSSWGCRNLFHGHLSNVVLYGHAKAYSAEAAALAERIAGWLHNCHLVEAKHFNVTQGSVSYGAAENDGRGVFHLDTREFGANFIRVFDKATTIENITDFVLNTFKRELQEVGVRVLYVSEGLTKGAVRNVPIITGIDGSGGFIEVRV